MSEWRERQEPYLVLPKARVHKGIDVRARQVRPRRVHHRAPRVPPPAEPSRLGQVALVDVLWGLWIQDAQVSAQIRLPGKIYSVTRQVTRV